jgi:lactosylceramide 4-alpha-galactosyltransferase
MYTFTTMRSAVLSGCLLLTLLFLARFYFTEESINAHFLSVASGIWTGDQPTTHSASEGNTENVSVNDSQHATLTGLEAEPVPGERHIIFLETVFVLKDSVTGKESGLAITQREACAVASAANTNPDSKVYLPYTCSIIGNNGDSTEYVKQMLFYPNVRIWHLIISDYIKGTPVDTWDFMGKIRSSKWPVVHASDILRLITLWKYGGTLLDMDFVIRK